MMPKIPLNKQFEGIFGFIAIKKYRRVYDERKTKND